ncbi:MAG: hypothetical protein H6810_06120 [Phycisphaeraceae bacterium]|nr:MAG: hypothetical protein H6810_06120 [Phycisphaeraceae bacterium]
MLVRVLIAVLAFLNALGAPDRLPPPPEPITRVERLTLAFYYPWYGSPDGPSKRWVHWEGIDPANHDITNSGDYPALGAYDSLDPAVVTQHMGWAHDAGLDGFVVSWWGEGTHEDRAVPLILEEASKHGLHISLYIERTPGDRTGPGAADATTDMLLELAHTYGRHPAFLKVNDRPVLFAYVRLNQQLTNRGWNRVLNRLRLEGDDAPIIIGDRPPDPIRPAFDGWHTYDPMGQIFHERDRYPDLAAWARHTFAAWIAKGRDTAGITCVTICPGYDDRYFRSPGVFVPRDGGETYRVLWREAIEASPDWILITSFNEWHETSEIEPSAEHGERYLDITREMTAERKRSRENEPRP